MLNSSNTTVCESRSLFQEQKSTRILKLRVCFCSSRDCKLESMLQQEAKKTKISRFPYYVFFFVSLCRGIMDFCPRLM
jgi:hypothetical protein